MIEFDYSASMQCNCITFDDEDKELMQKIVSRALNTWSNPPTELVKLHDELMGINKCS